MPGLIAPQDYNPGDLIHSEDVFARVLFRKRKDDFCDTCFKKSTNLTACKQCLSVKFCSKSCEKSSPDHQLECKHMKNLPKNEQEDKVRLLGKVILKIKDKDWKTVTTKILGKEVSFDDIDPNYQKMTEDPMSKLQCIELRGLLRRYIGEENMPKENDLIRIIGKVTENIAGGNWVLCFFLGSSSFDRECIPNSNNEVIHDKTMKVWACKKINKGSDKISITFRSVLFMDPQKYSDCKCRDCSLPYGESILAKIIDESRAFTVISMAKGFLEMINCELIIPMIPDLETMANELIQEQKGVLGETNAFHLRLLAIKCIKLPGNPLRKIPDLQKLEQYMSSVFGEYYLEMEAIYTGLMSMNLQIGNIGDVKHYMQKIKKLQIHRDMEITGERFTTFNPLHLQLFEKALSRNN